jgi:hypothetical protein
VRIFWRCTRRLREEEGNEEQQKRDQRKNEKNKGHYLSHLFPSQGICPLSSL